MFVISRANYVAVITQAADANVSATYGYDSVHGSGRTSADC